SALLLVAVLASITVAAEPPVTSVVVNFADGSSQTLATKQASAPATQPATPLVVLAGKGDVPLVVHVHLPENLIVDSTSVADFDFGDPTAAFNVLHGFNAGHVYDTPGVYTITARDPSTGKILAQSKVTATAD